MPLPPTTVHFRTDRAAEGPLIWAQLRSGTCSAGCRRTRLDPEPPRPVPGPRRPRPARRHHRRAAGSSSGTTRCTPCTSTPPTDHGNASSARATSRCKSTTSATAVPRKPPPNSAKRCADLFDIGADLPQRVADLTRDDTPATSARRQPYGRRRLERRDRPRRPAQPAAGPADRRRTRRAATATRRVRDSPDGLRREAKALSHCSSTSPASPTRMIERPATAGRPNLDWGQIQSPALARRPTASPPGSASTGDRPAGRDHAAARRVHRRTRAASAHDRVDPLPAAEPRPGRRLQRERPLPATTSPTARRNDRRAAAPRLRRGPAGLRPLRVRPPQARHLFAEIAASGGSRPTATASSTTPASRSRPHRPAPRRPTRRGDPRGPAGDQVRAPVIDRVPKAPTSSCS